MGWHEKHARYSYTNAVGQEIYYVDGANVYAAPSSIAKRFLVVHHTAGEDSRGYLLSNARGVSSHYLIGAYSDAPARSAYKYASERSQCTHTQGFSSIGSYRAGNINNVCVSIEIEGPPIGAQLQLEAALLARSIIDGWRAAGVSLTLLRHRDIDPEKSDPEIDWTLFCEQVYAPRA